MRMNPNYNLLSDAEQCNVHHSAIIHDKLTRKKSVQGAPNSNVMGHSVEQYIISQNNST